MEKDQPEERTPSYSAFLASGASLVGLALNT